MKSISKGKRGEREFAAILSSALGIRVVVDPHANSSDIIAIDGLSIEVKRQETLNIPAWWRQAEIQADSHGDIPVLAFRQNRKQWRICLPAYLLAIGIEGRIETDLDTFIQWLKCYLNE